MKPLSSHKYPTSFIATVSTALMTLAAITVITACSPKPSAEETAAQTKAIVDQAVEESKKEMLAEQHAAAANAKPRQSSSAAPSASYSPAPQRIVCSNCGIVLSVKEVETAGKGSGAGVVAGGVIGGVVGNQVGQGTGRDLATIAGVVGGAIAGNAIEKRSKKTKSYDITVKMDTGEERIVHQATAPNVVSGDAVKIENNVIVKK